MTTNRQAFKRPRAALVKGGVIAAMIGMAAGVMLSMASGDQAIAQGAAGGQYPATANDAYRPNSGGYQAPAGDAYRPPQGYGSPQPGYYNQGYASPSAQSPNAGNQGYPPQTYGSQPYAGQPGYQTGPAPSWQNPPPSQGPGQAWREQAYGGPAPYDPRTGSPQGPANSNYGPNGYGAPQAGPQDGYGAQGYRGEPPNSGAYGGGYANNDRSLGYGQPYAPPATDPDQPPARSYGAGDNPTRGYYEQGEIVDKGRSFFGSITQGLASAIEHTYRKAGRPNGYILGEDGGGAFFAGLRYGEGVLYTKDAGDHKVFWQGPSLGFDIGGEGSKVMVLVYNMRDVSDIFERYAGIEGSTYAVGGVSVQFQKHDDVTLAVIRSGVGLRLGANVGYSKFTRRPTWNPF